MRKTKLGVLEMVFFEKWKHLCWPKHTTERPKNKNKKRDLKDTTTQETPQNRNGWWKETFEM